MDQVLAAIQTFASAHPLYYGVATGVGGFLLREFLFTKDNARALIKFWFARQRAALKKAGRSDAEIKAIMEDEADLILAAATEAKAEADAPLPAPIDPAAKPAP